MNLYNSHYARCPHPSPSLLQGDKGQTVAQTVRIVNEKALLMAGTGYTLCFSQMQGGPGDLTALAPTLTLLSSKHIV